MQVGGIPRFKRFFRVAAGLEVDKDDLKRFEALVKSKVHDLLIAAEANARANDRGLILPHDLTLTKGIQEQVGEFRRLEPDVEIEQMMAELAVVPPLGAELADEAEERLPEVAGGIAVALARVLGLLEPRRRHPVAEDWERSVELFKLLV